MLYVEFNTERHMTDLIRPSRTDIRLIREYAQKAARAHVVTLEMGIRLNTEDYNKPQSANVLLVTNNQADPTADTDLADHVKWADFTKGVEAAEGGRGRFDFYVYERGPYRDLITNVQAIYDGGRLVAVEEQGQTLWVDQ